MKALVALAALLIGTPAVPQTTAALPIDAIARAKFAHADPAFVDNIAFVNSFVNDRMIGMSDQDHYGVVDLWVMYPRDAKGDCEDAALTKLGMLVNSGSLTVADYKIVTLQVHRPNGIFGHAILAIRLADGSVAYLDSLFNEPMTRKELRRAGYQFFDWKA